jgi:hypothetical protein
MINNKVLIFNKNKKNKRKNKIYNKKVILYNIKK